MKFIFKDILIPNGFFKLTLILFLFNSSAKAQIKNIFLNEENDKSILLNKIKKPQSGATLTLEFYTQDNNTPVIYVPVKLKNVKTGQYIDSLNSGSTNKVEFKNVSTPVEKEISPLPQKFILYNSFPNPFNPSTTIDFDVMKEGSVRLEIYNAMGELVKRIVNENLPAGKYRAVWGGENDKGQPAAAGVYFEVLNVGGEQKVNNVVSTGSGKSGSESSYFSTRSESHKQSVQQPSGVTGLDYIIEIMVSDATRPAVSAKTVSLNVAKDTSLAVLLERYLKPISMNSIPDVNLKEDVMPANSRIVNLGQLLTAAYDSLGNSVPDSLVQFALLSQDTGKALLTVDGKYLKLTALKPDSNGTANYTVMATAPNSMFTVKQGKLVIAPMTDLAGKLVDFENNPRQGYVLGINKNRDTVVVMTDANGNFSMQYPETTADTVKGHMMPTPGHNEAFIRTITLTGRGDKRNIVVDAVPPLDDSVYIGLDTLANFADRANLRMGDNGMFYEGLKKAKPDSLYEIISSIRDRGADGRDTITVAEQLHIANIIRTRIDPLFKKPSRIYIVPQDSVIYASNQHAINWFKNSKLSNPGVIGCVDLDNDGYMDNAVISLLYIINIIGHENNRAIVQEGLSARVAPWEVGGPGSMIKSNQTVLHKNTPLDYPAPADKWLVKFAEHYPPKTKAKETLRIGNFAALHTARSQD